MDKINNSVKILKDKSKIVDRKMQERHSAVPKVRFVLLFSAVCRALTLDYESVSKISQSFFIENSQAVLFLQLI